ncbi:MAG: methyltransferase family protein [Candidatus Helarchaeota archaeon]
MENKIGRKKPPLYLLLIIFMTLYISISIVIVYFTGLPWVLAMPYIIGLPVGCILLGFGLTFIICAYLKLSIKRAFGSEIYEPKSKSKLIKTGIYKYTRNPLYFGSSLTFFGCFFILQLTFILILSIIFTVHLYFIAKWEEKELEKRFGDEFIEYKKSVPFFIPYPKRQKKKKS